MKKQTLQQCVDSGSQYCPCHLAYSGDCIRCGLLNERQTCDCMWQGVCVYSEVQKSQNQKLDYGQRKEYLCKVMSKEELSTDIYLLKIKIPYDVAKELINPGTFVLVRSKDNDSFNVPISVMDVDMENEVLSVVIKSVGVKTKNLIDGDQIFVKAPYYNGILGIRDIKMVSKSNCMILLNGLSQVNSINVIRRLIENDNKVEVYINSQGMILPQVVDRINELGALIYYSDLANDPEFISDYITRNDVKLVYSGASSRFSKDIMNIIDKIDPNIRLCIANNNLVCCGEGICGACTTLVDGEKVKMCKTQVDSRKYLNSL